MTRMASTDLYSERGELSRPLAWSAGLHVAFSAFVILWATYITGIHGQGWGSGGGGEAMGATLVTSVPLPANPAQTTNVLATESKGLTQSQPKVEEKEPEAIPIADKNTKRKNKPVTSATVPSTSSATESRNERRGSSNSAVRAATGLRSSARGGLRGSG